MKTLHMNRKREEELVMVLLDEKVHEVFRERQSHYGIKSGDIEPLAAVNLDTITKLLSEQIVDVLMFEHRSASK